MNPQTHSSEERARRKVLALQAYADTCQVGKAAIAAGIGRTTLFMWLKNDEDFAAEWDNAGRIGTSALEDEAKRRAFEGVPKPVIFQGQVQYAMDPGTGEVVRDAEGRPVPLVIREYSDSLVALLLKAHAPEKYADRSKVDVSGDVTIAQALLAARKRTG